MLRTNKRVNLAALAKRRVVDRAGQPLGRVGALYVAMDEGRVEFVTLCLDSSPPGGRRDVVIPWSQFAVTDDGARLVLDISRDVLTSAATRQLMD